jgi:hypothetical protein
LFFPLQKELFMRIRSKFASVASPSPEDLLEQGSPSASSTTPIASKTETPDKPQTLWALQGLETNHGRAIGIRLCGETLKVGVVQAGAVRWLPAKAVLSERQARQWAQEGQFSNR